MCTSGLTGKVRADHCPSSTVERGHGCKYDEGDAVAITIGVAVGVLAVVGLIAWVVSSNSENKEQEEIEKIEGASLSPLQFFSSVKRVRQYQPSVPKWLIVDGFRFEEGVNKPDFAVGINILAIGDGR